MLRRREPIVYIIDRNRGYKKTVILSLESIGLRNFETFDNGENCFVSGLPRADIVILDYNLGEENWNGLEFMEEYERLNEGAKYLFFSSNSKLEIAVEAIRAGAQDYIVKSEIGLARLKKQVNSIVSFEQEKLPVEKWNLWKTLLFS